MYIVGETIFPETLNVRNEGSNLKVSKLPHSLSSTRL
jgi:hypothetical protein